MENRVAFAVSTALFALSTNAVADLSKVHSSKVEFEHFINSKIQLQSHEPRNIKHISTKKNVFTVEKSLEPGSHRYFVRLNDEPVATYQGGVKGFQATSVTNKQQGLLAQKRKLDAKQPHVQAYRSYLKRQQSNLIQEANTKLNRQLPVFHDYELAINGFVTELSQAEAVKLSSIPGIEKIERVQWKNLHTDTGPTWIGAGKIWDGSASDMPHQGEGIIVGIIDTGINVESRSFADVGDDGYDHMNPNGDGVYFGDCATDEWRQLCNDKLIGVVSYPELTEQYAGLDPTVPMNGVDHNGHGSHTASTAAGNVLFDVAISDAEGNPSDVAFERMSGVAPHANIISYQVCLPGENDAIGFSGCDTSLTVEAIEHAIENDVDVLNYSIGGGSSDPWDDSDALAFLSARAAGIHVATSAGNSGPGDATVGSPGDAPWLVTVGAFTHNRTFSEKELSDFSGGATDAPAAISGLSMTGGITGRLVYAGNFENPNDPGNDPAQCLAPFPADTFNAEQIVVCDRGEIARVQKGINVRDGGAGGLVLANLVSGATSVVADPHVIPAIHIDAIAGDALRVWLNDGAPDHQGTITGTEILLDDEAANIAAGFTSRGPGASIPNVMVPDIAAPGVSIFAAYASDQSPNFKEFPDPADFSFLNGTSMASPHVAGALALLDGVHPDWSPAAAHSAIMMTANSNTFTNDDGIEPATFFDAGAGMVQVDQAVQAGLLLNETKSGYDAANPSVGGDPRQLNMASLINAQCVGICSWERTFTAVKEGTWAFSQSEMMDGVTLNMVPESFSLSVGDTQTVEFTINTAGAENNKWAYTHAMLTATGQPDLKLPVAVKPSNGNIPSNLAFEVRRRQDAQLVTGLQSLAISDFSSQVWGPTKPRLEMAAVTQDSNNGDAYDDLSDGVKVFWKNITEMDKRFVVETMDSTSPDLDLYVGMDTNGDGVPQADEQIAISATASAEEVVDLLMPEAGNYWIIVQNWQASEQTAMDTFSLGVSVVNNDADGMLTVMGPSGVDALSDFDLRFAWNINLNIEKKAYAVVSMGSSPDSVGDLGMSRVSLIASEDDVMISANTDERLEIGDRVTFTVTVAENLTGEDREYDITATVPEGLIVDSASLSEGGDRQSSTSNSASWSNVVQANAVNASSAYMMSTNMDDMSCTMPDFGGNEGGYVDLAGFNIAPSTLSGDDVVGTFSVSANLLGTLYNEVTVADDGIIFMAGEPGTTRWINQLLPDGTAPNALVAPFWRDLQIEQTETSGVTVATAGDEWTIIEFDDMRHFNFYNGQPEVTDIADFEVIFHNTTGDFFVAYDNVEHTIPEVIPTTVGWEGVDGMQGDSFIYQGDAGQTVGAVENIDDGLVLCYTLMSTGQAATELTFDAIVSDAFVDGNFMVTVASSLTGGGDEFSDSEMVPVESVPTAVISALSFIQENDQLQLDGSTSFDADGDMLTYAWSQVSGPTVMIIPSAATFVATAPTVDVDSTVVFELTVSDGTFSSTAQESVIIRNGNPVIEIDNPGMVQEGEMVTLDGSSSITSEPNGDFIEFEWDQISGPSAEFEVSGDEHEILSFMAPAVTEDQVLVFDVMVTDQLGNSTQTTVSVTVQEGTPTVTFGNPGSVRERRDTTVTANGSDPNGDELTYTWTQIDGPTATISANGAVLNITAPDVTQDENLTFQVVVSDGTNMVTETVELSVENSSGGGALAWISLLAIPLIWVRRRKIM